MNRLDILALNWDLGLRIQESLTMGYLFFHSGQFFWLGQIKMISLLAGSDDPDFFLPTSSFGSNDITYQNTFYLDVSFKFCC